MNMTADEKAVLEGLEKRSVKNPVNMHWLSLRVGGDARKLRKVILRLRFLHGLRIGSSTGRGYWMIDPEDPASARPHCEHFRRRAFTSIMNEAVGRGLSPEEMLAVLVEEYDAMPENELRELLPEGMAEGFRKRGSALEMVLKGAKSELLERAVKESVLSLETVIDKMKKMAGA